MVKKFLNNFELYLGAILMAVMIICTFIQIVTRYLFSHAITWTEEVALICFVLTAYYGAVAAIRRGQQLSLDIVIQFVPNSVKQIFRVIDNFFVSLFMVVMIRGTYLLIQKLLASQVKYAMTGLPKYIIYGLVMFAMFMFIVRSVQDSIDAIHDHKKYRKEEKEAKSKGKKLAEGGEKA